MSVLCLCLFCFPCLLLGSCGTDYTPGSVSDSDEEKSENELDGDKDNDPPDTEASPSDQDSMDHSLDTDQADAEMDVEASDPDSERADSSDTDVDLDLDAPVENDAETSEEQDVPESDWELDLEFSPELEPDRDATGIRISEFYTTENPANVLSFFAEWQTDLPAATELHIECGNDVHAVLTDAALRTEHHAFVMGLVAESRCELRLKALGQNLEYGELRAYYYVSPLPGTLYTMEARNTGKGALQPGWTLFNQSNLMNQAPIVLALVDELGRYRWYYEHTSQAYRGDTDFHLVPEGILFGSGTYPALVSWQGKVLWTRNIGVHHQILPFGNNYLFLTFEGGCPAPLNNFFSDVINEYDPKQDKTIWTWAICDHYVPPDIHDDWSHMNAAEPLPGEDALLFSCREQHALFKLDRSSGQIIWKMGQLGDFLIADEDRFFRQHAPEIQPNGDILLFDNGDDREPNIRQYSRAIQLRYVAPTKTEKGEKTPGQAWVVWSYRPSKDIFCGAFGDADRLANGNTLVAFGRETVTSMIHEVSADNPGVLLWSLSSPVALYRAERIPERFGEILNY